MPRKQVNLVIGISIIAVSILTLFFSENNSKITSLFADPNQPETSKQTGIYDEEVLGQSVIALVSPEVEADPEEDSLGRFLFDL